MDETLSFSSRILPIDVDNELDDMHHIRSDHDEGIWESISS